MQRLASHTVLLLIIFWASVGLSQPFSSDVWHNGQVVLMTGDTLRGGQVMYNMETQTVQFSFSGKKVQAYSPRKVLAFELYDSVIDSYRVFYVLPYTANNNYEAPFIFELSYEGPQMSLLRTEQVETVMRNVPYMYATYTFEEMQYTYYFIDRTGRIQEFNGKKNDLFRIMRNRAPEIKAFIRDQNLKLDRLDHLVKICSYYNSLF